MRLLLAVLLFATAARIGLSDAERAEVWALADEYLDARAPEDKAAISAKLDAYAPSAADLAALLDHCVRRFRTGGSLHDGRSPAKCGHPRYSGSYLIQVPAAARKGAKTGVFLSLHGGGAGAGEAEQIQRLFGVPAPDLINVYPTVCEKTDTAWTTNREEQYVLAILDELKRTYAIDTNRVYVAGHSMGGYGAWSIGGRHPDLFAALSSMAGGAYYIRGPEPSFEGGVVGNLMNTPIWFYHSKDDPQVPPDMDIKAGDAMQKLHARTGAYEHVWKLYDEIGHGLPPDGIKPIFAWMLAKTRDPLPRQVSFEPSRPTKRHCYWLKKDGEGRIEASRDGNRIRVSGAIEDATVLLNGKMIDFAQPVVIEADGRTLFDGRARLSAAALVESYDARHDPEMVFTAWIRVR